MARILLVSCLLFVFACSSALSPGVRVGQSAYVHDFGALGSCHGRTVVKALSPSAPVVVMLHGCNASQARLSALSDVFELHDQQTLCFRYDDRRRIGSVASELSSALAQLTSQLYSTQLTLFGHSQGGLVARAALAQQEPEALKNRKGETVKLQLVTVSSPFNGIAAAADCGSTWLHVLTLGTTMGICRAVAGGKWKDIHPEATLVRKPRPLTAEVSQHVEVRTDERRTCRMHAPDGSCAREDFVFSLSEQRNPRIDGDPRVKADQVAAGHAEIVGSSELPPRKLLTLLQRHGILRSTPPDKQLALAALLRRLF